MTRVLIVDDHEGFRAEARRMLEGAGYEVVAEAGDGPGAIDAADASTPELVVLDVQLPGLDGFAVCDVLRSRPDAPTVVLVSSREALDYGGRIARSGAAGFISKADLTPTALAALTEPSR